MSKQNSSFSSEELDSTFIFILESIYGQRKTTVGDIQKKVNDHIDYRIKKYLENQK